MHRPPKNRVIYSASVSLPRGWGLNLMVIIRVDIDMGKKEVVIIMVKKFIVGICILELNLFGLIARVSYHRVCRRESKLIAACLTVL